MKRKALSKRVRFEVLKRDGFTCMYCGAHPPGVLLHVDHVVAVAEGGENDMDNLVTSCESCNLGKGARDLKVAPETLSSKAARVAEMERQLLGYQEIMQSKRDRVEDEMWKIADYLYPGSPEDGLNRTYLHSIKGFIERLGFDEVLDAAEIAFSAKPYTK